MRRVNCLTVSRKINSLWVGLCTCSLWAVSREIVYCYVLVWACVHLHASLRVLGHAAGKVWWTVDSEQGMMYYVCLLLLCFDGNLHVWWTVSREWCTSVFVPMTCQIKLLSLRSIRLSTSTDGVTAHLLTAHLLTAWQTTCTCWAVSRQNVCVVYSFTSTVYIHRMWPYIWWCACPKYHIYTAYIFMVLANPNNI